ncbi:MAG: hypothetical protein WA434_02555 [Candidatus Acidiferrales bacterium]
MRQSPQMPHSYACGFASKAKNAGLAKCRPGVPEIEFHEALRYFLIEKPFRRTVRDLRGQESEAIEDDLADLRRRNLSESGIRKRYGSNLQTRQIAA